MRFKTLSLGLISSFVLSSCAEFRTHRSYLTEMEHDDSTFYRPNEDFPVMAGDTGRSWSTEKEMRERVPASEADLAEAREKRFLKDELKRLEESQSEDAAAVYEKYRNSFTSTSEKIYFLRLGPQERKEYLDARGWVDHARRPASVAPREMFGLRTNSVALGMSKDDVLGNFGKPMRVDVAGNPRYENERWLYVQNGATKYIYFEGGRVEGWE